MSTASFIDSQRTGYAIPCMVNMPGARSAALDVLRPAQPHPAVGSGSAGPRSTPR